MILESTYPLMAAMLGVASGRGSRLKMIIIWIHNTSLFGGEYLTGTAHPYEYCTYFTPGDLRTSQNARVKTNYQKVHQ